VQILKVLLIIVTSTLFISCAVYSPKLSPHQTQKKECKLVTQKLTLELTEVDINCGVTAKSIFHCLVSTAVIIPLSGVVSGSIVLVGNTLHWAEKELSCTKP
jgi:hypothetical protein